MSRIIQRGTPPQEMRRVHEEAGEGSTVKPCPQETFWGPCQLHAGHEEPCRSPEVSMRSAGVQPTMTPKEFVDQLLDQPSSAPVVRLLRELEKAREEIARLSVYGPHVDGPALFDSARLRPLDEYDDDMGPVIWWRLPIVEPPWVGTPNDTEWKMGWPSSIDDSIPYYTHFTLLLTPGQLPTVKRVG